MSDGDPNYKFFSAAARRENTKCMDTICLAKNTDLKRRLSVPFDINTRLFNKFHEAIRHLSPTGHSLYLDPVQNDLK